MKVLNMLSIEWQTKTFSILGLEPKDSLTILLSFLMLVVTIITNIIMQNYWNRRKIAADLKSKSRIEWIQDVRKLTAELLSVYYDILSYEKTKDYKIVQRPDKNKELLATAQEKTQLLMLYYGFEGTVDLHNFDIKVARKQLIENHSQGFFFVTDKNNGKNKWMSAMLNNTYTVVSDSYGGDEDLNSQLLKAGKKHDVIQNSFIESAKRMGLMYDNVSAVMWKEDKENKIVDEELLKAKNILNALYDQKQDLYSRMDFIRESTSIYLKHEWDRAKRGK